MNTVSHWLRLHWARFLAYLRAKPKWQRPILVVLWGTAGMLALLLAYVLILIPLTPGGGDLQQVRSARASSIVAADGKVLATFEVGLQERVKLDQISHHVVAALLATEDKRFYEHHGIDFRRTVGAIWFSLHGDTQGGSTLTQQLARNAFPDEIGRSRSLNRKLKELITALKLEAHFSKQEILEAYLNTVPFLYNTYGIEMAARTYFRKSAAQLDVLEAATLVGMLKGTNYYNPVTNPERAVSRRNVVLAQMQKAGQFDAAKLAQLEKRPIRVRFTRQAPKNSSESHFTANVRRWAVEWADANDYDLERDGLVIHTTLDPTLQAAALQAVEKQAAVLQAVADVEWGEDDVNQSSSSADYVSMREGVTPFAHFWRARGALLDSFVRESLAFRRAVADGEKEDAALRRLKADREFLNKLKAAKSRLEAGLVALDPATGEVKAWVGSRDFQKDQFDHVAQAARQPGSTFKPVVYGAALEKGLSPDTPYRDAVMDIRAADGSVWRPTDMSGTTGAMMTMREGLVYSKNTITAQVMRDTGLAPIAALAQGLGIRQSKLAQVPSLALGTSPVTLLEMASAYSTIAARGEYRKPIWITSVTDRNGRVVAEFSPAKPERVLGLASADNLVDMLRGVVDRGTGTAVRYRFGIQADVAGKTGTTQNNTDGWFMLMHPQLVAGAWVGFNDNRVTMRSSYWGQGGHNAILLVGDFFKAALAGGKLDAAAKFPAERRALPPRPVANEEVDEENPGSNDMNPPAPEPAPMPEEDDSENPPPATSQPQSN